MKTRYGLPRAFSLVEMIAVIATITLLMGMVIPAFTNIGKANALNAAGNMVVNLANFARQNSMAKNTMTAMAVLTGNLDNKNRTFALLEFSPTTSGSGSWKQITAWQTLPGGTIAVQPASNPYPFDDSSVSNALIPSSEALPKTLSYGGTASTYDYVVFLPGGNLLESRSAQLQLAEGYFPPTGGAAVYTHPAAENPSSPADYYRITILSATGRTKIDRP